MQVLDNVHAFCDDTLPNYFFDYIADVKPVLNNYPGWLAAMISDNSWGYASKPTNVDKFAEASIWFSENKSKLPEMGSNARALA